MTPAYVEFTVGHCNVEEGEVLPIITEAGVCYEIKGTKDGFSAYCSKTGFRGKFRANKPDTGKFQKRLCIGNTAFIIAQEAKPESTVPLGAPGKH